MHACMFACMYDSYIHFTFMLYECKMQSRSLHFVSLNFPPLVVGPPEMLSRETGFMRPTRADIKVFLKALGAVPMSFIHVNGDEETRAVLAYQLKEHEEKEAEAQGHSTLDRGRELCTLSEVTIGKGKNVSAQDVEDALKVVTFARDDTVMNVKNIRQHLRILRRLSLAVVGEGTPAYKDSALYFFDRNEEIWGRRCDQVAVQESPKYLDTFQATLPSLGALRDAAENFHVALLRGFSQKVNGRQCGDHARAFAAMNRVPTALIPRFPSYSILLKAFSTYRAFHTSFPSGLTLEGDKVTEVVPLPVHAQESLEKIVQEVLVPLFSMKRHQNLMVNCVPLAYTFVKDLLPELEAHYLQECVCLAPIKGAEEDMDDEEDEATLDPSKKLELTEDEVTRLRKQHREARVKVLDELTDEFFGKNIVCVDGSDISKEDKIAGQPLLQDGSAAFWNYNAGVDCTKDPRKRQSWLKMKGQADELKLKFSVNVVAKHSKPNDTGVFLSGGNKLIEKDLKKELRECKPKLHLKELGIDPDEAQVMNILRATRTRPTHNIYID